MSARKTYNPADYEPCLAGCGRKRWRGDDLPVCAACRANVMDIAWKDMRLRLTRDNASLDVLNPFDQALVADCKETLKSATAERPFRRRHQ